VDANPTRPTKGAPSLWPKEHGAYAMLLFPLVCALLLVRGALPALVLALGVVLAFLAHEPLLVLLGRRGPRALRALGASARPRLALLASLAVALGVLGLWLAPVALHAVVLPLVLALLVGVAMATGREKTLGGELLVSAAFASACVPLGVAGRASQGSMGVVALVWFLTFALEALAVKATLSRLKGKLPVLLVAAAVLPLALLVLCVLLASSLSTALLALVPACVASFLLALVHVHPRKLRVVGWALVGTDAAVLLALLLLR